MATEPPEWSIPSDADILAILTQRIDVEHQGVGIVVGVTDQQGRRIVAHGALGNGDSLPLDGDTVFEIGSITKAFTALVLADMALRGEVDLDDPVVKHLPAGVTMPERGGKQITLAHLATHASGLPRWPSDLSPRDWSNPYADYTVDRLHAFLSAYSPRRDIGAGHLYSNLGVGLLGHVLALRAGADYEALVRQRITGPLYMSSTAIALSPALEARLAIGHDVDRRPVANWDMPTFAGAGALRSTANDLLTLLEAELGYAETPLKAAMSAQLEPRRPGDSTYIQTLGWRIDAGEAGEIVWHGGATGGYRCFILFDRQQRRGVVILANSASIRNDDIGFHLVNGRPLEPAPPARETVRLGVEELDCYVGRYQFSTRLNLIITRRDERLFAQMTGQGPFEVFAESPTKFFWKIVDAEADFTFSADGRVTGLVLHQKGRDLPAARVA